jgi:HSF-type DNA-binding
MQHWNSSFAVINCRFQLTFWIGDKSRYITAHTKLFGSSNRTFIHGLRVNCEHESHFGHCIGSSGVNNTEHTHTRRRQSLTADRSHWPSLGIISSAHLRTMTTSTALVVVHDNYRDYAHVTATITDSGEAAAEAAHKLAEKHFPAKLHEMLSELERQNKQHIVSWRPHGRCFMVHRQTEMVQDILPQ